jgi:hypothetical protein
MYYLAKAVITFIIFVHDMKVMAIDIPGKTVKYKP